MPLPRVATPRVRRHAAPHRRGRRALFPAHVGVEARRPPARRPGPGPPDRRPRRIGYTISRTSCVLKNAARAPAVRLTAGGASIFYAALLVSREESRMGARGRVKMSAPPAATCRPTSASTGSTTCSPTPGSPRRSDARRVEMPALVFGAFKLEWKKAVVAVAAPVVYGGSCRLLLWWLPQPSPHRA
jgi:hypothetical protein